MEINCNEPCIGTTPDGQKCGGKCNKTPGHGLLGPNPHHCPLCLTNWTTASAFEVPSKTILGQGNPKGVSYTPTISKKEVLERLSVPIKKNTVLNRQEDLAFTMIGLEDDIPPTHLSINMSQDIPADNQGSLQRYTTNLPIKKVRKPDEKLSTGESCCGYNTQN